MYEHHSKPLLSPRAFMLRLLRQGCRIVGIMLIALWMGMIGYRVTEQMPWLDALLNAAMILGGMGPVTPLATVGGKIFASLYALFSGIIFIAVMGLGLAPFAHRLLHYLHLETDSAS